MSAESTLEKTVAAEQAAYDAASNEGAKQEAPPPPPPGQDAEKGKLFEVPRVKVAIDDTDPTVLKLAFSGGIELDRTNASDVEVYNRLKAGRSHDLQVSVHVAGAKTSHRRDSEGDVDAVVQTKSLVITGIDDV